MWKRGCGGRKWEGRVWGRSGKEIGGVRERTRGGKGSRGGGAGGGGRGEGEGREEGR